MVSKAKISLLALSAAVALATQAQGAALNLDLRFAPGQSGVGADSKTATVSAPGTYQLQLWAQVTDATHAWSTDMVNALSFGLQSSQGTPIGALSAGGVTAITVSTVTSTSHNDAAASNTSNDGVADWGAAATNPSSIITSWAQWANSSGFAMGTTSPGASGQVSADVWEVLLATFTFSAAGLPAPDGLTHTTGLGIVMMDKYAKTPSGTNNANTFTLQGNPVGSSSAASSFSVGGTALGVGVTAGPGVSFVLPGAVITPEPASLAMLGLGGLASLARRRK